MPLEICKLLTLLLLFLINGNVYPKEARVLVISPKTNKSLETVYSSTVKGIKNSADLLKSIKIVEKTSLSDLQNEIDHYHPDKIIALGQQAVNIIFKSPYRIKSLAGLIYFDASEYQGISLALDSRALISKLQRITPHINRVFIVQNSNRRVIANFSSAMQPSNRILMFREGNNLLANMQTLGQLLENQATKHDAILLPADIPKDILYEISKIAWDKKIMLLSTNLSHLEYGALFVFYPNLNALGQQLAELANKDSKTYEAIKTIDVSLNQRVAQHLGIQFNSSLLNLFSVIVK